MKEDHFSYKFKTSKTAREVFDCLLNVKSWWWGLYDETIDGKSQKVGDEFSFKAGGGAHYSKQKLIELVPDKKLVWRVTDSRLPFLKDVAEWNGTQIRFDLSVDEEGTAVAFTHQGLVPPIECYDACSSGWTGYLDNLKKALN